MTSAMRNGGEGDAELHNHNTVETRTVGARLIYFTSVFADFTIFPLGDFLHILQGLQRLHYPPQVAAPEVPQRGAAAGVKIDAPAWGLSLSTLTDSWRSPRSNTKNFGERDTTAKGPL